LSSEIDSSATFSVNDKWMASPSNPSIRRWFSSDWASSSVEATPSPKASPAVVVLITSEGGVGSPTATGVMFKVVPWSITASDGRPFSSGSLNLKVRRVAGTGASS
jgi:hypothetical protein